MLLWRPVIAEPPLCSVADLDRLTIDDFADMNEALDLRAVLSERAAVRARDQR